MSIKMRRFFSRFLYAPSRRGSGSTKPIPRFFAFVFVIVMLTMLTGMFKLNPTVNQEFLKQQDQMREEAKKMVDTNKEFKKFVADIMIRKDQEEESAINEVNEKAIDVVYTWVNGSDPEHIRLARLYKLAESVPGSLHKMVEFTKSTTSSSDQVKCNHRLCIKNSDLMVIIPMLPMPSSTSSDSAIPMGLKNVQNYGSAQIEHIREFVPLGSNPNELLAQNVTVVEGASSTTLTIPEGQKAYMGFYTADCSMALNCITNVERTYILRRIMVKRSNYNRRMGGFGMGGHPPSADTLPDYVEKNLEWKIKKTSDDKIDAWVIKVVDDDDFWKRVVEADDVLEMGGGVTFHVYKANIVWDLGDPGGYLIAANRFGDHNELKYSMRSVEKHMPWVRKIHIVTNGQVPSWLNLSHPKIRIVTHDQIFTMQSYLPTFSSPAIEANLHRIKGLSKQFIYLNDDILITLPAQLNDFWTPTRGFRFHLSWQAPNAKSAPCDVVNTYDCSVRHVTSVLDRAYGPASRRVPAHGPHFFDRDIIDSMIYKFSDEFEATSAGHFRRSNDMQFEFAYVYYVIHENKWRFEKLGETDIKFLMIEDKPNNLKPTLDLLRRRPKKFVCFNDDIDYQKKNEAIKLRQMLEEFFHSSFPDKSSFEL